MSGELDRQNITAHPCNVTISEPIAEEFIRNLLEDIVLQLTSGQR
jgi:hypothetical protein